jgi:hypothetical protein
MRTIAALVILAATTPFVACASATKAARPHATNATQYEGVTNLQPAIAEEESEAMVDKHVATERRAASEALRGAEARTCAGLADEDRDTSPFEHPEDIVSVDTTERGAVITLRGGARRTLGWLEHIVDCHLARDAALGNDLAAMPDCPLVPAGVTARVTETDAGFAVTVSSDDPVVAAEVRRRARALVAH